MGKNVSQPSSAVAPALAARSQLVPSLLTDAAIIAAASSYAYAVAFAYEAGFLEHYGLPIWIIQLDLAHVLVALTGMTTINYVFWWIIELVPTRAREVLPMATSWLAGALALWLALLAFVWLWDRQDESTNTLAVIVAAVGILIAYGMILQPLWKFKTSGGIPARYRVARETEANERPRAIAHALGSRLEAAGVNAHALRVWFTILSGVLGVAFLFGYREAVAQDTFLVSPDTSAAAVRSYGDHLIVAHLDSARRSVTGRLSIVPVAGTWTRAHLGRVHSPSDSGLVHRR
jgi:hypothetical protein